MWTVADILSLIRRIHPEAFAYGWNLHLGGGLASTADNSNKDADILAMPRYQTTLHDRDALADYLRTIGWATDNRWEHLPHREIRTFWKEGRVLELIFVILP